MTLVILGAILWTVSLILIAIVLKQASAIGIAAGIFLLSFVIAIVALLVSRFLSRPGHDVRERS